MTEFSDMNRTIAMAELAGQVQMYQYSSQEAPLRQLKTIVQYFVAFFVLQFLEYDGWCQVPRG